MTKKIKIKILNQKKTNDKFIPYRATNESAGLDLLAYIKYPLTIMPNTTCLISTGIAIHINNPKITAIILPRSGLGHHHGIVLGNLVGLIDSDYQGTIMISLWNRSQKQYIVKPQEKIAQLVFIPVIQIKFKLVQKFIPTMRNKGNFGHSGKF